MSLVVFVQEVQLSALSLLICACLYSAHAVAYVGSIGLNTAAAHRHPARCTQLPICPFTFRQQACWHVSFLGITWALFCLTCEAQRLMPAGCCCPWLPMAQSVVPPLSAKVLGGVLIICLRASWLSRSADHTCWTPVSVRPGASVAPWH